MSEENKEGAARSSTPGAASGASAAPAGGAASGAPVSKPAANPYEGQVYDPYRVVDPADKAARRRQRQLAKAARRGYVPVAGESRESFERRAVTPPAGAAPLAPEGASDAAGAPATPAGEGGGTRVAQLRPPSRRPLALIVAVVVLALALVGVGGTFAFQKLTQPAYLTYSTVGISIVGIEDEPFTVTPADLAALPSVTQTVSGQGQGEGGASKAGTVTATGPTMETFLAQYGLAPTDFTRIKVVCKDDYDVILARDSLESEVILTVAMGNTPLDPYQQPLRLVLPDESSSQWGYGVIRIEFEK